MKKKKRYVINKAVSQQIDQDNNFLRDTPGNLDTWFAIHSEKKDTMSKNKIRLNKSGN